MAASWCPRCGSDLVAPGPYDSAWRCGQHGPVLPLGVMDRVDQSSLDHVRSRSEVPLWVIDPAPLAWQLCGLAFVGDPRGRIRATVTAYCGPAPLGGAGEWLIIAEEPGIGLGAAYARSEATAGSAQLGTGSPAKIHTDGRPTPLWIAEDADGQLSAYVGEAQGVWIWLVSFPADAGYAVLDDLTLADARSERTVTFDDAQSSARLRPMH